MLSVSGPCHCDSVQQQPPQQQGSVREQRATGEGSAVTDGGVGRRWMLLCVFHVQLYALLAVSIFFGAELRELHKTGLSLTYWSKCDPALTTCRSFWVGC
mmetsp:Transcript_35861/g.103142  ORF Transcript_35861/g.103142 Transcript_35861/m.103142 type:complete len:100 (+) Transcript_35861:596-895(+)